MISKAAIKDADPWETSVLCPQHISYMWEAQISCLPLMPTNMEWPQSDGGRTIPHSHTDTPSPRLGLCTSSKPRCQARKMMSSRWFQPQPLSECSLS